MNAASRSTSDPRCSAELAEAGQPYTRNCERCNLGPCYRDLADDSRRLPPLEVIAQSSYPLALKREW